MLDDTRYMKSCLELARKAEGRTSPNPLVGAVVVNDSGDIIAEGFHAKAGQAHAEVVALEAAGELARGQTLYVSLEPCCHHGKTPPCTDRIIASGVKRVVFGMVDPNPKVQGGGQRALHDAGIETHSGVLQTQCRYLNRGFLKWIEHGRPWVCLKIAATIDGRIADHKRQSRWISGTPARAFVHTLRDKYDCVMIGGQTAVQDNPALTARVADNHSRDSDQEKLRDPIRAVIDARLSVSPQSRLGTNDDGKTWLFALQPSINERSSQYGKSVRLIATPVKAEHLDLSWVLHFLGEQSIRTVLCEGGSRLAGSLLLSGLVDEIEWIIAPKLLLDKNALSAVNAEQSVDLSQAIKLISHEYIPLGDDLRINGLLCEP